MGLFEKQALPALRRLSLIHILSGEKFRSSQDKMRSMAAQMTELNIQLMAEQDKNKGLSLIHISIRNRG